MATKKIDKKEPTAAKRVDVRLVGAEGKSALVEWIDADGMYRRVYVPLAKVDKGTVPSADLAKGIPYGLAWEEFIEITATPEQIANELRRQGIWRWQDIRNDALTSANRAFDQGEFLRRVDKEVRT